MKMERMYPCTVEDKIIGPGIEIPLHPEVNQQRRLQAAQELYSQGFKHAVIKIDGSYAMISYPLEFMARSGALAG